ncbi:MAG TPA: hypothetical protein VIL32_05915 [Steroidobacteraceae bacterium]
MFIFRRPFWPVVAGLATAAAFVLLAMLMDAKQQMPREPVPAATLAAVEPPPEALNASLP